MNSRYSSNEHANVPDPLLVNYKAPVQIFNNCEFNTTFLNNINGVHCDSFSNQLIQNKGDEITCVETQHYLEDKMSFDTGRYTMHIKINIFGLDTNNHRNEMNITSLLKNGDSSQSHPFSAINSSIEDKNLNEAEVDFRFKKIYIPDLGKAKNKKESQLLKTGERPLYDYEYNEKKIGRALLKEISADLQKDLFDLEQKAIDLIRKIRRYWSSSKILYPIPFKRIYRKRRGKRRHYNYMEFVDYSTKIVPISKH